MKKEKKQNKLVQKYFGEQVELRMKITRMIFVMIFMGLLIDIGIVAFDLKIKWIHIVLASIGMVVLLVALVLSSRVKNVERMVFWLLLPANLLLFPLGFYFDGGTQCGEPMWMLLGLLMGFLMLNGWRLYVLLFFSVGAISFIYVYSYIHPITDEPIHELASVNVSSATGLFIVSIIVGLLFRYQNKIYDRQGKVLEQRMKEIEDLNASKSLFFANMSHEIRTPINTIIGLNEMILREDVTNEVAENAINIQNASKILLALINDILDLSKMESGKMEIVPAQYETASMFSDLVNIIWVRANQKGLEFKLDISEDIPSMLYGDEVRIKQILTNIMTNAVKYTEKGSVTLTVTGEKIAENRIRLKIAVEDTGIGIRKESMDELFTVFKRFDQEKTKKIEGTGLGLSISKQLVDMMGGTIEVDSIYQKGSCFTITLEQGIIDSHPIGSMHTAAKKDLASRVSYERSFEAPDAHVLVVDDNEMNLMVAKKLLRDTKVQVDLASSGKECLEKTKEKHYHIILMDHMMPGMNGEETLNTLRSRQDGFCQKTPVVALTANVMTNANQWYQERGFDGYLAKPISGSLLEAVILKFLPEELIEYSAKTSDDQDVPEYSAMMFHKKKKRIAVCAECVCDLPQEWVDKFDISLMYYYVMTEEGRFIDTSEIGSTELMEYMARGKRAYSSAAPQEEYEAFFADRLLDAEQVLFLTVASDLNNKGYVNAMHAAKNFDHVTVINSGHLSGGMGLMVLLAAKMAADGAQIDEITDALDVMREKISTSFMLQTVDNMYLNQRISKTVYTISKALKLHPVLRVIQSRFVLGGFEIGKEDQVEKRYIQKCLRNKKSIDKRLLFVNYVGLNARQLEEIRKEILRHVDFEVIKFQKASATISSNSGMGTFGLMFFRK